jgi:hypothetical protein
MILAHIDTLALLLVVLIGLVVIFATATAALWAGWDWIKDRRAHIVGQRRTKGPR